MIMLAGWSRKIKNPQQAVIFTPAAIVMTQPATELLKPGTGRILPTAIMPAIN
ncbi:MAG: hypothetical protein ABH952_08090 [Candidatus Omnitrophota bacterium]